MNYFGGNERSSSAGGSSSRKGKKSGSDKPKQPQRGLGVAQLEKIRLHSQMGFLPQEDIRIQTAYSSSSSFSYTSPSTTSFNTYQGHHSHMMGMGELERPNTVYSEPQLPSSNLRWDATHASSIMSEAQHYAQPAGISIHHYSPELVEDSMRTRHWIDQNDSMRTSSQNSGGSNGSQELDLELRLAL